MADMEDLLSLISHEKTWANPSGIVALNQASGFGDTRGNSRYVSSDSTERWFLMDISVWGDTDIVGE